MLVSYQTYAPTRKTTKKMSTGTGIPTSVPLPRWSKAEPKPDRVLSLVMVWARPAAPAKPPRVTMTGEKPR